MNEGKTQRRYDRAFKEGAVRLVIEGGQTMVRTARDLGITENMLQRWKKEYLEDRELAFPGQGRMKPEDAGRRALRGRPFSKPGRFPRWIERPAAGVIIGAVPS